VSWLCQFVCFSVFFCFLVCGFSRSFFGGREREDQDGSMSVFFPFFLFGLVGFEQLERVKQSLTSTRCKAPANEKKIEQ
jgi:hypothetical protein